MRGCSIRSRTHECPTATLRCISFWQLLLNPWGLLQYAHNMTGAVVTGSFVMAAVGAFYLLEGKRREYARDFSEGGCDCRRDFDGDDYFPDRRFAAANM